MVFSILPIVVFYFKNNIPGKGN